jgi:hypothetical protein
MSRAPEDPTDLRLAAETAGMPLPFSLSPTEAMALVTALRIALDSDEVSRRPQQREAMEHMELRMAAFLDRWAGVDPLQESRELEDLNARYDGGDL